LGAEAKVIEDAISQHGFLISENKSFSAWISTGGWFGWVDGGGGYLSQYQFCEIMIINRIWPLNSLTLISSTFEVLLNKQVI